MKDKWLSCSPTSLKRELSLNDREQVSVISVTVIVRSFSSRVLMVYYVSLEITAKKLLHCD